MPTDNRNGTILQRFDSPFKVRVETWKEGFPVNAMMFTYDYSDTSARSCDKPCIQSNRLLPCKAPPVLRTELRPDSIFERIEKSLSLATFRRKGDGHTTDTRELAGTRGRYNIETE